MPSGAEPADGPEALAARERLVDELARALPRVAPAVLSALRSVPRHLFMPGASLAEAYDDHAHAIGHGQTISQPTVVALMTDALELRGGERVLEVGTGSGYQAAVLARLGARVHSIERIETLAREAAARIARLVPGDVVVHVGDGATGLPREAPFDRILLTAAARRLPEELLEQLAPGGILVAEVGDEEQWLGVWREGRSAREGRWICPVRFVPLIRSDA